MKKSSIVEKISKMLKAPYLIKTMISNSDTALLTQQAILSFGLKLLGATLAFLFTVSVARMLGTNGAGIYFLAISLSAAGSIIGRIGLDQALLRSVAIHSHNDDWDKVNGILITAVKRSILVSTALALTGILCSDILASWIFQNPELSNPIKLTSAAILPLSTLNLLSESLKGIRKVGYAMLVQSVLVPFISLLLVWPLANYFGVSGAAMGYLIATTVVAIVGVITWNSQRKRKCTKHYSFKTLWQNAKQFYVISLTNGSLTYFPTILIGLWVSAVDIGLFGAASRLAVLLSLPLLTLNSVLSPKYAQLHELSDYETMGSLARKTNAAVTLLTAPFLIAILIFSEEVMMIFGSEFSLGGGVLRILVLGVMVNLVTGSVNVLLAMSGDARELRIITTASAIAQLVAIIALAPKFGVVGSAAAISTTTAMKNIVAVYIIHKKYGIITLPLVHNIVEIKASKN